MKQAHEHQCPECIFPEFKTKTFENFRQHMKWKHTANDFPCFTCNKRYVTKEGLKDHIEIVHDEHKKCKICGLRAENEELLKEHLKSHPERVGCSECGLTVATRMDLRTHMLKHHEEQMTSCGRCGVKVTSRHEL